MKRAYILLFLTFCASRAYSQVKSGSIIVFARTDQKFIIAADSRTQWSDKVIFGESQDDDCKIAAFKNGIVYAAAGSIAYRSAVSPKTKTSDVHWTATDQAIRAVSLHAQETGTVQSVIDRIADSWAGSLRANWDALRVSEPKLVVGAAVEPGGIIVTGIFAHARGETCFRGEASCLRREPRRRAACCLPL